VNDITLSTMLGANALNLDDFEPRPGVRVHAQRMDWGSAWDEPFFGFIHANADVVRAVAYINADWNVQPMWDPSNSDLYWGDSRVQANPIIKERWLNEISNPFWLHGSEQLFTILAEHE
jgi:hypothetical protein